MKLLLFSRIILGVIIALTLSGVVQAGESKSIPISVTIPVIPGVNSPAIQQDSVKKTATQENITVKASEANNGKSAVIQEEETNTVIAKADGQAVRTIYSR